MPTISVIIPVYNGEKTIQATIQSVLDQTFADFELLVIDDGSTDRTLEVVAQITDPRLKVLSFPNRGVAVSRNLGFQHSSGAFISFIDADDLWTPDKLEAQLQQLENHPQAAIAYSWTNCIDDRGKFLRQCSYVHWSGDVLPQLLLDDFIGSGSNVMIRREAYAEVGGFDQQLTNAQDTDLWLRLAARYHFVNVPSPQILYRISQQSMSSNLLGLEASNLTVIERAFAQAPDDLQHLKSHAIANLYKYLSYKALDAPPGQQQTWTAARFLFQAAQTDLALLKTAVLYKGVVKLLLMNILSPTLAQRVFNRFPKLATTSTFLGYEKTQ
ncbi:MAG TPA: glycosyltransferase [Chroococcidiopsis sp.]